MAMGDVNNQQNRRSLDDNYYSRTRITANQRVVGFSFWKGMLKLSISERIDNQGSNPTFNELAYIHLSPTKARIFKEEIDKFMIDPSRPRGVNSGSSEIQGVIIIGAREGSTPETPRYFLLIGKVDATGKFVDRCELDFNFNYHSGLVFNDIGDSVDFEKEYYDDLEVRQLKTMLEEYCWSCNGATGYFSADIARYETARMENKIDDMVASMGIERKSSRSNTGNNGGGYNKSVFGMNPPSGNGSNGAAHNSSRGSSYRIEDMENDMLD